MIAVPAWLLAVDGVLILLAGMITGAILWQAAKK